MQSALTLVLVRSAHRQWDALRDTLAPLSAVHIVGDIDPTQPLSALAGRHPTVMLVTADLVDRPPVPLVRALRALSPDSKIILLGATATLDGAALITLQDQGIKGYLVWEELRPKTVRRALILVVENASVTPSVAPSYAATDAARKIGVSPNVSNATGGQYTGRQGFAISYWVGWNNSGGSVVNIVSSTKAYGCCTNWKEDDLYANGTGTVFDRGCMALPNGSWTSQQGLPGTYPSGVEYYNETSDCGLFPANAYGYTYLNN